MTKTTANTFKQTKSEGGRRLETTNAWTSRIVIGFQNSEGGSWSSRLYVNGGETATLTSATHKTEKGARNWAKYILGQ